MSHSTDPLAGMQQVVVPANLQGCRFDRALAELFPHYSRSLLKTQIESGHALLNAAPARPRDAVKSGDVLQLQLQVAAAVAWHAEPLTLNVVYADEHLIVINKPAGIVVHPGAGNLDGTLANALLHYDAALEKLPRAGIVHRLDKETSGLLVVARSHLAHTHLVAALTDRDVAREYDAIVNGVLISGGTVNAPISRHPQDRVKMSVQEDGREAVTHYRVRQRYRAHTHVRVILETGRTHQIRVHMQHAGYPLVGDGVYGGRLKLPRGMAAETIAQLRQFKRQALHAAQLTLAHPAGGEQMSWQAPLPTDMTELLQALIDDKKGTRDE